MLKYHCHACGHWLFSYEEGCMVEGKQIEMMCRSCKAMNYIVSPALSSRVPLTMSKPILKPVFTTSTKG